MKVAIYHETKHDEIRVFSTLERALVVAEADARAAASHNPEAFAVEQIDDTTFFTYDVNENGIHVFEVEVAE